MNNFEMFNSANFQWIFPLVILELVLKGFALWRAARNNQLNWFIALLVLNTAGILPLIYLYLSRKSAEKIIPSKNPARSGIS